MTKVKRIAAVLLAVIMMLSGSMTVFAASYKKTTVTLPEGKTSADVEKTVDELWKFIASDVAPALTDQVDLRYGAEPLLTGLCFKNETIGKVYGLIANLSHANSTAARFLVPGIFTKESMSGMLFESKFSGAAAKIAAATVPVDEEGKTIQVPVTRTDKDGNDYETTESANIIDGVALIAFENGDFGFNDYDKQGFVTALEAVLRPLTYVLGNHQSGLEVDTKSVYEAVVPVLEELGCKLPTPDAFMNEFNKAEAVNPVSSGDKLLAPIFDSIMNDVLSSQALADPLNSILKLLPRIGAVVDKDMLTTMAQKIVQSIPIAMSFVDPSTINLGKDKINKSIADIDLIELITKESGEVKLTLSAPDWTKLANASDSENVASALGGKYELRTGDKAVVFTLLFYYLYDNFLDAKYPIVKGVIQQLLGDTLSGLVTGYTDRLNAAGKVPTYKKLLDFFDGTDATADAGKSIGDTLGNVSEVLQFGKIDASDATIKLSRKTFNYNGKYKKPVVTVYLGDMQLTKGIDYKVVYQDGCKNVGNYKVNILFIGTYSGNASASYRIRPAKTKIVKVKSAKKALKVSWKKKAKQNNGYEIQIAKDKKFTNVVKTVTVKNAKKSSKKIKGLAKGKYFVRVRTFKAVNGTTSYGKWSKAKKAKAK